MDIQKQIDSIQKEIRETPYHKGTEHHVGMLRARLARLKDKMLESTARSKGGGSGGYAVKKQGDATLVLVGPPSSGKSTLLNKLTNANSKIAPYAFTTVTVIPGMMDYKDAKIQILDVPGLIEGAEEGKGRGREVLSVVRGSDLIILMTDIKRRPAIERINKALERNGIRLNQNPPDIRIDKKIHGGIIIHSNITQPFDKTMVKNIASEMGIKNAEITIKEKLTLERLIDAFSNNRVYIPSICIINKVDLYNDKRQKESDSDLIFISAEKGFNIDVLKEIIWEKLGLVRVYLVKRDEEPDFKNPVIIKSDTKLIDISRDIGSSFTENITRALIWGPGSKFPAQEVSLSTTVKEGMQIRFV